MNYLRKSSNTGINDIIQEITGAYYLIPNIEKFLIKILNTINCELSLIASTVYFKTPNGKPTIVTKHLNRNNNSLKERISELSENLIKENYPLIKNKKTLIIDQSIEACIIPIGCEFNHLGLIIFFGEKDIFSRFDKIIDTIGIFVTAACVGNYFIAKQSSVQNNCIEIKKQQEISVKKLIQWRIQEIINNLFNHSFPEQGLYKEISQETEKTLIKSALDKTGNNQSKAAIFLGINRNTLRKKMKEFNIN